MKRFISNDWINQHRRESTSSLHYLAVQVHLRKTKYQQLHLLYKAHSTRSLYFNFTSMKKGNWILEEDQQLLSHTLSLILKSQSRYKHITWKFIRWSRSLGRWTLHATPASTSPIYISITTITSSSIGGPAITTATTIWSPTTSTTSIPWIFSKRLRTAIKLPWAIS